MKPRIGIYIPKWLRISDESDQMFADELEKAIKNSGRYEPILLNLPKLIFTSTKEAENFVIDNNLVLIVQHDSKFYSKNPRYAANMQLLESYVPFVNSTQCQEIGHDKIATKNILRKKGIPVLDDKVINSLQELEGHLAEDTLYVIKPHNLGAGAGVKLIKKQNQNFFGYQDGKWRGVSIVERKGKNNTQEIKVKYNFDIKSPLLFLKKTEIDFAYSPMLVEPYFNNHNEGFSSLRCTVIGDEVVESIKRTNHKNITSNISSGGRAEKFELTDSQRIAAITAKNAIGADYAGVDFLIRGDEWVIGEINIGPFTLFTKCTGVNVGKIFGEYLIKKCDAMQK